MQYVNLPQKNARATQKTDKQSHVEKIALATK
ncbi:hypothetical protein C7460_102123 [Marinoscillum furvescens DSM 4134]|uniref:Uncharacterized protein n=1 Tax=Marinoscillum furvescens DSM 4134 TaxID=1122208 RepID=A0A3D9LA21_MARFU|nr:hypothetical protein C7460_102123 [Marinoscillum furvescens DSM 4134]